MFKNRKWVVVLILLISFITVAVFWVTLQQSLTPSKSNMINVKSPTKGDDEFLDINIKIPGAERNGYWELHVDKSDDLEEIGRLSGIQGGYFSNKILKYRISGKNGVVYWKSKTFVISNEVVLQTADGSKKLLAGELVWNSNQKRIAAQHDVVLKTVDLTVNADGLKSNLNLDQINLTGTTKILYQRKNNDQ